MALPPFSLTWDYRCPFARNVHEHVVVALQDGADWDVTFVPFTLDGPHTEPGQPEPWDDPERLPAQLSIQVGLAVRDTQPAHFLAVHHALFSARHDQGLDLKDRDELARIVDGAGGNGAEALAVVDSGEPLSALRKEHEAGVRNHQVFGVPTFIIGDQAAFVRVMTRPQGDAALARTTIERVVEQMTGFPELNELKHTSIPR
jgi:hypothetical protein